MRKRIVFLILSLIILSSFGVCALDKETLQKQKFTGWNVDKESQKTTYYKDGNMLKSSWKEGKYYFKEDGTMAKGWLSLSNNWYYFTEGGAIKIGWFFDDSNNSWYYLDQSGIMKIGWLQYSNGKWYYFNADGKMAHDTTIDGYKIGSNGAWIK